MHRHLPAARQPLRRDHRRPACEPSSEDNFNQDLIIYELRVVDDVIQVMLD